jgi:HAE1 family hydrophobic/amphiphilic exporter-1
MEAPFGASVPQILPVGEKDASSSLLYRMVQTLVLRPFTTLTLALAILLLGAVSFFYLRVEYMPTLHIPVVHVVTEYPGFPAAEVERLVTIPLENGLSAVQGLQGMESITKDEVSTISLRFDWKVDLRTVTVDIREKIDSTYPYLPFGIQKPLVFTEDLNADPILVLSVVPGAARSIREITPLVRKELASRLLRIEGVSSVRIVGTAEPEVLVEGKRDFIQAGTITLAELAETIQNNVFQSSLGTLTEGDREFLVEADTGVDSLEGLENLPLRRSTAVGRGAPGNQSVSGPGSSAESGSVMIRKSPGEGSAERIGDVARVTLREKERTSFFHWNGKEGIGIFIHKMPDASTLRTARKVMDSLPELNSLFQREFRIQVVENPTRRIVASFENLLGSLGMGVLAVFLVLFLTFRNLTYPLIISFSIPLSTLGVFFYMYLAQIGLNTVSLSGIALGVGMIVDNSIVILENLHRRRAAETGEVCISVVEVFPSLFSSTLTTVLVFLPIALIPGVLGALFQEQAFTISCLLAISLVSALFFTPTLYLVFRPRKIKENRSFKEEAVPSRTTILPYRSYLLYTFRHPAFPLCVTFLLVGVGCIMFTLLPRRMLPEEIPDTLLLTLSYPAGTSLEKSSRETEALEKRILPLPGVTGICSEGGYEARSLKDRGTSERNSWTVRSRVGIDGSEFQRVKGTIESLLAGLPGVEYRVEIPSDGSSRLLGSTDTIRLRVLGPEREGILSRMENLFHETGVPSLAVSAVADTRKTLPQKTLEVQEDLATFHGITPRYILDTLGLALRGTIVSTLPLQGEDVDIRIRLGRVEGAPEVSLAEGKSRALKESLEVGEVPLPLTGGMIQAGWMGTLRSGFTYPELHRTDRKPSVTWTFHPKEGKREALETLLESLARNFSASNAGITPILLSRSALEEQGIHVVQVFATALLLMYLVLGAQFESFLTPLLLLISFPLSASGSFLCLYLVGYSLNLNSFLGILVLFGTIINGTILLTSAYRLSGGGGILKETVAHLKPLLATVNTTLVAMTPLILSGGGSLQAHTAVALGGGLGLGTLGIVAVYPGLYRIFFKDKGGPHG